MKKILSILSVLVILAACFPAAVSAQSETITIVPGPVSVPAEIASRSSAFLASNNPAETNLYVVTHITYKPNKTYVSIAGLRPDVDQANLSIEKDAIWWDKPLVLLPDGTAQWFELPGEKPQARLDRFALMTSAIVPFLDFLFPPAEPGGGAMIGFPFTGRAMFGPRGVHGAGDYGFVGGYAVDWVGGDDLGANVMPSTIIASADGTVVGVCSDDTTVAITVNNGITNDKFVYAHLVSSTSYEIGDSIFKGGQIGKLQYGNFDDTCGWASQANNHYHVHWMFDPEGGYFQVGKWVLNLTQAKWVSGSETVEVNGWMDSATAGSTGTDDAAINSLGGEHIWDGILRGLYAFVDGTVGMFSTREMGEGGSKTRTYMVNTVVFIIRFLNLIKFGAYSITAWIVVLGLIFVLENVRWTFAIIRTILKIIPGGG